VINNSGMNAEQTSAMILEEIRRKLGEREKSQQAG
jgi:hypothetical protein